MTNIDESNGHSGSYLRANAVSLDSAIMKKSKISDIDTNDSVDFEVGEPEERLVSVELNIRLSEIN